MYVCVYIYALISTDLFLPSISQLLYLCGKLPLVSLEAVKA